MANGSSAAGKCLPIFTLPFPGLNPNLLMKFLLVTDLDNTLVGDAQATLALNLRLATLRDRLCLIYATGRSYGSAQRLKHREQLLQPDFWVTGVGTEIHDQGQADTVWAEWLAQDWQRDAIATLVQSFPELIPQSSQEQNPRKLSYFLRSPLAESILANLQLKLSQANLAAKIIFSSEDVDILPVRGDKGLAVTYLREKLQIPAKLTLVCGDSGNDISLFQQSTLGVIVRNAQPELLNWHRQQGQSDRYCAQSSYAWGILEALFHFKLLEI